MIMPGSVKAATMMMGPSELGRMCLNMMRLSCRANAAGGFDELIILQRKHLPAHNARLTHPVDHGQRNEQQEQAVEQIADTSIAQRHHHDDKKQQVGEGIDHIRQAHQQVIRTGRRNSQRTSPSWCRQAEMIMVGIKANHHGNPRAVNHPAEHIAAQRVGAEQEIRIAGFVRCRIWSPRREADNLCRCSFAAGCGAQLAVAKMATRKNSDNHDHAHHRAFISNQAVPGIHHQAARRPLDFQGGSHRLCAHASHLKWD